MTLLMSCVIIVFALLRVPIALAFGLGALFALAWFGDFPLMLAPIQIFGGLNSFILIAVPLFILVGVLMTENRIAEDIFRFARSLVGSLPGGLGHVNIVSSLIFAGISGSAAADAGGIGKAMISAQTKFGYPLGYVAALTSSSAILSSLVPPSLMAVLYGVAANVSISRVMIAGFLPGLVFAALMMTLNHVFSIRNGWDPATKFSFSEVKASFRSSFFSLIIPVVLIGGILGGIFTPTEAAGVAVAVVVLVDMLVYRTFDARKFASALLAAARLSGAVLIILSAASLVGFVLTVDGIPQKLTLSLTGLSDNPIIILLLINVILLVGGMFLDPVVSIVLFVPLLLPTVTAVGVDPVHFGVIVMANLATGLLTPPLGSVLFVTSAVSGLPVHRLVRHLLPFYAILFVMLVLITYVPVLSLVLPNLAFG